MYRSHTQKTAYSFRKMLMILALGICVLFAGCALPNSSENTLLSADESGTLTQTIVEPLDGDDFTEEELTAYAEAEIASYNSANGSDTVSLEKCTVKNDVITISITYASYEDYSAFNGMDCYMGVIDDAEDAGYSLSGVTLLDASGNDADTSVIAERSNEWKVLVVAEQIDIKAPDKILYASDNVEITGRLTATVTAVAEDGSQTESVQNYASATDQLAYVIYK